MIDPNQRMLAFRLPRPSKRPTGTVLSANEKSTTRPARFRLRQFAAVLILVTLQSRATNSFVNAADFNYPLAVTATKDGIIFVADRHLPGVWKVENGKTELYFKGSKKFRTPLNAVRCLAISKDGKLLAGDSSTRDVYRFDAPDKPVPLTKASIGIPTAIAVAADGTLFVADTEVHRIWKVPAGGGKPAEFATIAAPRGLSIDSKGRLWILSISSKKGQVQRLPIDGSTKDVEVVVADFPFEMPHKIVTGKNDEAWVSDNYANAIWKIDATGKPTKFIQGKPMVRPVGLFRQNESFLIADPHAKTLFSADKTGKLTVLAGP